MADRDSGDDSWRENRLLVASEMKRISHDIRLLNDKVEDFRRIDAAEMKKDIALLKFQAALYGAIAGLVSTGLITFAIKLIRV